MEKIFPDITSNDEVVERHYFLGKLLSTCIIHLDGVFGGFHWESNLYRRFNIFLGVSVPFLKQSRI